ncbi:hypothetical protein B0H16DRAFT_1516424 [Mycena metata]|uniref:Secreted protein n=1 Tax=Mycena metata TaxID=1033252 RepID=A0AAD7NPG5_9AGAR|nr:hypothetical protein B0H16DRAFT_1516424 [Mycena metata]
MLHSSFLSLPFLATSVCAMISRMRFSAAVRSQYWSSQAFPNLSRRQASEKPRAADERIEIQTTDSKHNGTCPNGALNQKPYQRSGKLRLGCCPSFS